MLCSVKYLQSFTDFELRQACLQVLNDPLDFEGASWQIIKLSFSGILEYFCDILVLHPFFLPF